MITADALAQTIQSLARNHEGRDVAADVVAFLKKKGALALLPRVVAALNRREEGRMAAQTISVARTTDADVARAAAKQIGITDVHVRVVTDDTLIGGFIVSNHGAQIDTSYKSALLRIYRSAVLSS